MKNRSLFIGIAASVCAALVFFGCESPADGAAGSSGVNGPGTFTTGDVDAAALEAVYALTDTVVLTSGVDNVDGLIPAGKTLVVVGDTKAVNVKDGKSLEVEGTLEIKSGAELSASGISSTDGTLKGTGSVTGEGAVALPFIKNSDLEAYEAYNPGGLTYLSGNVTAAGKYVGSYEGSTLTADSIKRIFELEDDDAIDELSASGITTLTAATIPAGKTLTLTGSGNTFATAFDLSSAGNLVVKGTLGLASGVSSVTTITGNATTANITIAVGGELSLGEYGRIAGKIENNGTITSAVTTGPEQAAIIVLAGLSGSGKVVLSGTGTTAAGTATLALAQDVKISGKLIAPGHATPFSGGKTITVATGGTLDLGATATTLTGATIVNGGTVATATTTTAALNTILALEGTITSKGDVAGTDAITVPADTTFTHDTGTFVGGAGTLTIEGTATFTTGTFASQTGKLTVNGTATFTEATFAALTSLEVGRTLRAEAATFAALTTVTGTGSVTAGAVSGVTASPKAQILIGSSLESVSLATTTLNGELTIPADTTRTFTGAFAPDDTVTVNGTLVIDSTGSLTLKNALTLGTDGALALVAGAEVTLGHADATITGGTTYEITPEVNETTGTLTAGEEVVVFTAGTITGMADEDTPAAATLAFGTTDSVLTVKANMEIAALTLDVSAAGVIEVAANQTLTLKLAGDDGELSGGILTKASTAASAVKANAFTQASTPDIADAAGLAAAKVEKAATATAGNLATGTADKDAVDGVITDTSDVTIDKEDTFAAGTGTGAITVTHA